MQRQSSGTLGKTANCQLEVSVNAVTEQASCPLDWRLSVPESWDEPAMASRRAARHLPGDVHHRPKWQLVLDMPDGLDQWGLWPPVLVAGAGHGEVGEFRQRLDDRGIRYVVQVKADTSAYPTDPYDGGAVHRAGSAPAAALPRQARLAQAARLGGRATGRRGADMAASQQGPATLPLSGLAGPPSWGYPRGTIGHQRPRVTAGRPTPCALNADGPGLARGHQSRR